MSKKRTKAQKKKVATKRVSAMPQAVVIDQSTSASVPATKTTDSNLQFATKLGLTSSPPSNQLSSSEKPIIRTEPRLIKKDLKKSLLVSLLLLSLLLGIYFISRYNVISLPFLT